jgi:hypothetical protein
MKALNSARQQRGDCGTWACTCVQDLTIFSGIDQWPAALQELVSYQSRWCCHHAHLYQHGEVVRCPAVVNYCCPAPAAQRCHCPARMILTYVIQIEGRLTAKRSGLLQRRIRKNSLCNREAERRLACMYNVSALRYGILVSM